MLTAHSRQAERSLLFRSNCEEDGNDRNNPAPQAGEEQDDSDPLPTLFPGPLIIPNTISATVALPSNPNPQVGAPVGSQHRIGSLDTSAMIKRMSGQGEAERDTFTVCRNSWGKLLSTGDNLLLIHSLHAVFMAKGAIDLLSKESSALRIYIHGALLNFTEKAWSALLDALRVFRKGDYVLLMNQEELLTDISGKPNIRDLDLWAFQSYDPFSC